MIKKIVKIGGLVILGIVVVSIALALAFGKPEKKKESIPIKNVETSSSTNVVGKIAIKDFLKYVKTYEAGGFKMEQRPNDAHSYIGFSDDLLNALEINEKDGLVYKVVIFTQNGKTENENALSIARLIGISGYINGNNNEIANWITSQLQNTEDGFVTDKKIDNLRYEISWDTKAVLSKWRLQINYQ